MTNIAFVLVGECKSKGVEMELTNLLRDGLWSKLLVFAVVDSSLLS